MHKNTNYILASKSDGLMNSSSNMLPTHAQQIMEPGSVFRRHVPGQRDLDLSIVTQPRPYSRNPNESEHFEKSALFSRQVL